jgi:acyl dehydratase
LRGMTSDELVEGATFESHRRTITETDIVMFASLTWITDPIFTDQLFAETTQFGQRVAPGPLLLGYALGLTEELVYGTTLAALAINNVVFKAPVPAGSTIQVRTEVGPIRRSVSRAGTSIVTYKHEVYCDQQAAPVCVFERNMLVGSASYLDKIASRDGVGA